MNILHSTGMPFPTKFGGYERWLVEVCKQGRSAGHNIFISYKQSAGNVEEYAKALKNLKAQIVLLENDEQMMSFCADNRINIVHFHFDFAEHDWLYGHLWKKGVHLYATLHCECGYAVDHRWMTDIRSFVRVWGHRVKTNWRSRYFKKILPCSHKIEKQYREFYFWKRNKTQCLYLGIPRTDNDGITYNRDSAVVCIACVAFHSPVKGVDVLLNALKLLKDRGLIFRCIQIGGGSAEIEGDDTRQLKQMCTQLGLDDVVHWIGITNHVNDYLKKADIYCQPSRTEAMCLSIAESMNQGLPVVATDVGGTAEMVEEDVNGWLVKPEHPELLADRLEQLICDSELRRTMGMKSRKKLDELNFYQDKSVAMLLELYQDEQTVQLRKKTGEIK